MKHNDYATEKQQRQETSLSGIAVPTFKTHKISPYLAEKNIEYFQGFLQLPRNTVVFSPFTTFTLFKILFKPNF